MKRKRFWLAALMVVGITVATQAWAQKGIGDSAGVARQTVKPDLVTISGTVTAIKTGPCEKTTGPSTSGTHILMQTAGGGQRNIHLGPTASVDHVAAQLKVGKKVTTRVFRTDKLPKDNYVAQSVTVDGATTRLRDENLRPMWAGAGSSLRGRGPGRGRGCAQGRGQGCRRGQERGRGCGRGQGRGCGQAGSQGWGQGRGRGQARRQAGGWGSGHCPGPACANRATWTLGDTDAKTALTDVQAKGLRQLREDEKLAHDVYVALAAKWKVPLFARISQAESRHMDAVARLLNVYKLTGPVGDRGLGEFSNPEFTTLYQQLVQAGSVSLAEAYKVGARIEELDISDLRKAAAGSTQPIVRQVFGNLERASRNHLRAFASQLDAVGATYTARHLTQDQFDAIANSSWEAGHGNRRGGRGRGRGQAGPRRGGNGGGPGWGRGSGRGTGHGQFAHQGRRADFGRSPRRGAH